MKCRSIAILLSSSGCVALAAIACAGSGVVDDDDRADGGGVSPDGGGNVLREGGGGSSSGDPYDDSGSSSNKDGGGDSARSEDAGPAKRLFVTKALFAGNFGSVANGDALCQSAAGSANLGGTWKAWLSDSTKGARAHVGANGPWALMDGSMVFNQTAATFPIRDLDIDETGTPGNKGFVWTGTNGAGTTTANTCNDWQGSGSATTGYPHDKNQWTDDNSSGTPCNFKGHLYCFEQ